SYSLASGRLPAGLSLSTTGVLSGTPTQPGSFTLRVLATDANSCSGVSTPYQLTVSEPLFVGTLRLIAPIYNCQSGAITFRTVGIDNSGTPVEYRAIGVTDWTTNPNQVVDLPVRQDANVQPLLLQARQGGVMVTYTFDFWVYCNSTVPNQPPVFT